MSLKTGMRTLLAALAAATGLCCSTANGQVVISQVYGGASTAGSTYTRDFVELFNRGTTTVSLSNYSLQYATATGTAWTKVNLTGSIAPGGYYLFAGVTSTSGAALPAPDFSGTLDLSTTTGKVALVANQTALPAGQFGVAPGNNGVVDFVAYGASAAGFAAFEGGGPTGANGSTILSISRLGGGCTDANNNAADFAAPATPVAHNSASPANPCATLTGACCIANGECRTLSAAACATASGTYGGNFTICTAGTYTQTSVAVAFDDLTTQTVGRTNLATAQADDASQAPQLIPFPFYYFGSPVVRYSVNSNGWMAFFPQTSGTNYGAGETIPAIAAPNMVMSIYRRDLNGTGKNCWQLVKGTSPNRQLVIQWDQYVPFGGTALNTFQVILNETSNVIEYRYATLAGGAPNVCGLEEVSGTVGVLVPNASVVSNASFQFTPIGECPVIGACCNAGACISSDIPGCTATGGAFSGAGTTCNPNPCTSGSCCLPTGTCAIQTPGQCAGNGGVYQGDNSICGANACPASGSCCVAAACSVGFQVNCTGTWTAAGICTPNPCAGACCTALGVCSLTTATGCTGTFAGTSTTCTTNPCAGDLCTAPIVLSGSGPFPLQTLGNNSTAVDITNLTPAVCASSSRDFWYSFTPTNGALSYSITTCNSVTQTGTTAGGILDTVVSVHSACPTGTANNLQTGLSGNCSDDSCTGGVGPSTIPGLTFTAGQTYLIRVAMFGTNAGGTYRLDIITEPFGACCSASATCILAAQSACIATAGNAFVGGGTLCNTVGICNGACCATATGVCTFTTAASCVGTHGGVGSACTVTFCPTTSCCNDSTGACTTTGSAACPAGTTPNAAVTCTPAPCPTTTCCNNTTGACTLTGAAACPAGTTPNAATTCTSTPCPISVCCNTATGVCSTTGTAACPSGSTANAATSCTVNPCPQPPPPSNDLCANPISLSFGVAYQGTTAFATGDATEGPVPSCQSSFSKSVWFSFTAQATTNYHIYSCGTLFDNILTVFSGPDCNTLTQIGCDDDTCVGGEAFPGPGPVGSGLASDIATTPLVAGQTYTIRLSGFGAASGAYGIVVEYVAGVTVGSCCVVQTCTVTDSLNCTGTFTSGGACIPNPCVPPGVCCRGATCNTTITTLAACAGSITGGTAGASFPNGTVCNALAVSNAPCCYGDYNKVGGVTVTDIFNFLSDWFAGSSFANVGGDGSAVQLTVQNIFDFLSNWFAGCP